MPYSNTRRGSMPIISSLKNLLKDQNSTDEVSDLENAIFKETDNVFFDDVSMQKPKISSRKRLQSADSADHDKEDVSELDHHLKRIRSNRQDSEGKVDEQPKKVIDQWCDPENPRLIHFDDICAAEERIKGSVIKTPCTHNEQLSEELGMEIFFKKELLQATGSFKERGGRNALCQLSTEKKKRGVIAASSGNHALGLSYHGQKMGIPVTVCMPETAPLTKITKCRKYGATVLVHGKNLEEAKQMAMKLANEKDYSYINGFDHPHILAGQGTVGLEIADQMEHIDAIIIPAGGGGLLAGTGLAMKTLFPNVTVIGVEGEMCPSYTKALQVGQPIYTPSGSTLADGLAVPVIGVNSLHTVKTHKIVDKMVTVSEDFIALSIVRLLETEKTVVEGAGAVGLAAILSGQLQELCGKRVAVVLTGGNIDMKKLSHAIESGLAIREKQLLKTAIDI